LQLFTEAPLQVDSDSYHYVTYQPTLQFDSYTPVSFHIAGNQEEFIDPQIVMRVTFKITKSDGSDLDTEVLQQVAVAENAGHTIWSDINMKMNGKVVSGQAYKRYPYICWLDHVFKASKNQRDDLNAMQALYTDTEFDNPRSPGFVKRRTLCLGSAKVRLEYVLNCEISRQSRLILPMVDLDITCTPSSQEFRVESHTADGNELLQLIDAKLICKKVKVNAALYNDLIISLQSRPAVYPIKRYACVTVSRTAGSSSFSAPLLSSPTKLPEAVYLMILHTEREMGDRTLSPFKLSTNGNLNLLHLSSQGVDYPNLVYKPQTDNYLTYVM